MEPYVGEIRLFSQSYAPRGWAVCNGQELLINGNQALYSLLGNVYGGNGVTTFALPDLRGRVPIHPNNTEHLPLGALGGEKAHVLTNNEMPAHTHLVQGTISEAGKISPENNVWAKANNLYQNANSDITMNREALATAGGGAAHNNMQPYLSVNFCIALTGIYPSRN